MMAWLWLETMVIRFFQKYLLTGFSMLMLFECIISLKLVEFHVPTHVPEGTRAELTCQWQLGPADVLYSVKWYKDGKEFFRHVPREVEPRRRFPLPGVDVEKSDSSGSKIILSPAGLATSGRYRCEVSGERPLFPTVSEHADMLAIVLPDHGPVMSGFRSKYRIGDRVQVSCTSGGSRPPTHLAWYINGEPASSPALLPPVYQSFNSGLETTSSILDFNLTKLHFKNYGLKVKCLATLPPVYWRSNEESAIEDRSALYDRFETHNVREVEAAHHMVSNSTPQLAISSNINIILIIFFANLFFVTLL